MIFSGLLTIFTVRAYIIKNAHRYMCRTHTYIHTDVYKRQGVNIFIVEVYYAKIGDTAFCSVKTVKT